MENTVNLNDYKLNKISKLQNVSTIDMIFNPVERKNFYADIDKDYSETDDKKEIFYEMTRRRTGE